MNESYVALIGDIVKSKKIAERNEVQLILEEYIQKINMKYKDFIISKFLITLGDEFQGLLKPSAPVYEIICSISEGIYPVEVRIGLGFGPISTPIKESALGMDGPAFYLAREAINQAKTITGHSIIFKSNYISKIDEETINTLLGLVAVIRKLWTKKIFRIAPFLREGKTQKEIAQILGIKQPTVSGILKNSHWHEVHNMEKALSNTIECILSSSA